MRSALDREADAIVAELISLGAVLTVSRRVTGPDLSGQVDPKPSWAWEPRPEVMRGPIKRYLTAVDTDRAGFADAMYRAILRTQFVGAP